MKLFKSLLVAPATLGLLAPLSVTANEMNIADVSGYSETPEVEINHVGSMIDSLDAGDNVAAQDAFKNALTDKIGQALDDKRMTVANDWLNAGDDLQATQDAAGLDQVEVETETTPEPVEIDQDQEVEQDEQPVVSEV